ncbi:MAG: rhodanese-like domain-containing protein [Corynebacterium sp.]|nr:rhodanese-like domain-containing protein [Corynebacterium sp.]
MSSLLCWRRRHAAGGPRRILCRRPRAVGIHPIACKARHSCPRAVPSPRRLPGAHLWPLATLLDHLPAIRAAHENQTKENAEERVVVYCASGMRSAEAVQWLAAQGVAAVSLVGGMEAWLAAR